MDLDRALHTAASLSPHHTEPYETDPYTEGRASTYTVTLKKPDAADPYTDPHTEPYTGDAAESELAGSTSQAAENTDPYTEPYTDPSMADSEMEASISQARIILELPEEARKR